MHKLIKKITANNGGVFTGNGTNTYLIGSDDITLIDPGPNDAEHIEKILSLGGDKIKRILVTHTHKDHSPAALPISKKLNIPMFGRLVDRDSEWEDETFVPDVVLNHGDTISTNEYSLETIHTPGHASNHLCFYMKDIKCLLTGDHIMDGSTVVIAPPDGNMTEYIDSLKLLENYDIDYFAPGHGNFMEEPSNIDELLLSVYDDVPEMLHPIAKMSLLAHLIKLEEEGRLNKNQGNYSLSS
jgi:glyoxylase-like metal-dependent hydrolase (beta-lactamase superfamily II)